MNVRMERDKNGTCCFCIFCSVVITSCSSHQLAEIAIMKRKNEIGRKKWFRVLFEIFMLHLWALEAMRIRRRKRFNEPKNLLKSSLNGTWTKLFIDADDDCCYYLHSLWASTAADAMPDCAHRTQTREDTTYEHGRDKNVMRWEEFECMERMKNKQKKEWKMIGEVRNLNFSISDEFFHENRTIDCHCHPHTCITPLN